MLYAFLCGVRYTGTLACLEQDYHEQDEQRDPNIMNEGCFPLAKLTAVMGEEQCTYFPALLHLVVGDSAYLEMNSKVTGSVDYGEQCYVRVRVHTCVYR